MHSCVEKEPISGNISSKAADIAVTVMQAAKCSIPAREINAHLLLLPLLFTTDLQICHSSCMCSAQQGKVQLL